MKTKKSKGVTTVGITLLMTSGLMASALGIRQLNSQDTVPAWVLNKNIAAGHVISIADIKQHEMPEKTFKASPNSIQNPRALVGKKVAIRKFKDELLFNSDFQMIQRQALSEAIPAGRVLYSLKLTELGIPLSRLHKGDRFDIVANSGRSVRTIARNVQLIGLSRSMTVRNKSNNPKLANEYKNNTSSRAPSLVLAVQPQDVYSLAGISASDNVSVIVHSAFDVEQGKRQDFTHLQTTRVVEVVKGVNKESISVAR